MLVEHLQHADGAVLVQEGSRGDRARHVARLLSGVPVEAWVAGDVRECQCLASRVHVAGDALGRRHGQPDCAGSLRAGGNAKFEPIRILLEQRDRRRLGVEELDRRVDDALQQPRLGIPADPAGNGRSPRRRDERGVRGGR